MSFEPAKAKLTLGSLDRPGLQVSAQYNPKELQVDKSVPWQKPSSANKTGSQPPPPKPPSPQPTSPSPQAYDGIAQEFMGVEGRTMSVELLFDGYEQENGRAVDVAGEVGKLEELASVIDPFSLDERLRRPHHCVISWGDRGLPKFKCVIESLSTKYTMFGSDGEPLRATCTVKLKEAHTVDRTAG